MPDRSNRQGAPGSGRTWTMRCKAAPEAPAGALGTLPASSPPPGPSQRPPLRVGLPHLSRHRQTRKTVRPASAPWRGQAPRDPEPSASAPRLTASARSSRGAEDGERRRGTSCPWPSRGASSGRRAPLKFTSCICKSIGETRGAQATRASAAAGVGGGLFPRRCFDPVWVMKRSPVPQNPPLQTTSAFPSEWLLSQGCLSQSFHNRESLRSAASARFSKGSKAGQRPRTR